MNQMLTLVCLIGFMLAVPVNAVERCAGYKSPGNTYGHCTDNPKGDGNCVYG